MLAVYTGSSVTALTLVASNDDHGSDLTSRVSFNALGGEEFQIAVDGYAGAGGRIVLTVTTNILPSLAAVARAASGEFVFGLSGESGRDYRIEASDDLQHWVTLKTVLNFSGYLQFTDAAARDFQQRFYRVVLLP